VITKGIGIAFMVIALGFSFWLFQTPEGNEELIDSSPRVRFQAQKLTVSPSNLPKPQELPSETSEGAVQKKVSKEALSKTSPLTNDEIQLEFSNYQRQFQNCWIQRFKDKPDLNGQVSFKVQISPRGKISEIQLVHSDIDDPLMLQCLNSTLSRMQFREFEGEPIEVIFPLEFAL
tara:strand:- start:686 stop:1210 length:525 start_codon:yes stop_codon:yes gene_type:complete